MGIIKLLQAIRNLTKIGSIKSIEQAYKLAQREVGERFNQVKKQVDDAFNQGKKEQTLDKRTKDIKKIDEQGIKSLETEESQLMKRLEDKVKNMANVENISTGLTRTIAREILSKKGIELPKGTDPLELFKQKFGQDILIDVNNLAEELVEMDRRGIKPKPLTQLIEQEGFFDIKMPKEPPQGFTPDELADIQKEIEQEDMLLKFDPTGRKANSMGGINRLNFATGGIKAIMAIINQIKKLDPIEAMKEVNKVIARKGKYKNITDKESQKIFDDTQDHIFEREPKPTEFDIDIDVDEIESTRKLAPKMTERLEIKAKYPGIDDELVDKILIDDNPQRKAEVLATLDETFKMMNKGMDPDEIIDIFKNQNRTKQASGTGPEGLSQITDLYEKIKINNVQKQKDKEDNKQMRFRKLLASNKFPELNTFLEAELNEDDEKVELDVRTNFAVGGSPFTPEQQAQRKQQSYLDYLARQGVGQSGTTTGPAPTFNPFTGTSTSTPASGGSQPGTGGGGGTTNTGTGNTGGGSTGGGSTGGGYTGGGGGSSGGGYSGGSSGGGSTGSSGGGTSGGGSNVYTGAGNFPPGMGTNTGGGSTGSSGGSGLTPNTGASNVGGGGFGGTGSIVGGGTGSTGTTSSTGTTGSTGTNNQVDTGDLGSEAANDAANQAATSSTGSNASSNAGFKVLDPTTSQMVYPSEIADDWQRQNAIDTAKYNAEKNLKKVGTRLYGILGDTATNENAPQLEKEFEEAFGTYGKKFSGDPKKALEYINKYLEYDLKSGFEEKYGDKEPTFSYGGSSWISKEEYLEDLIRDQKSYLEGVNTPEFQELLRNYNNMYFGAPVDTGDLGSEAANDAANDAATGTDQSATADDGFEDQSKDMGATADDGFEDQSYTDDEGNKRITQDLYDQARLEFYKEQGKIPQDATSVDQWAGRTFAARDRNLTAAFKDHLREKYGTSEAISSNPKDAYTQVGGGADFSQITSLPETSNAARTIQTETNDQNILQKANEFATKHGKTITAVSYLLDAVAPGTGKIIRTAQAVNKGYNIYTDSKDAAMDEALNNPQTTQPQNDDLFNQGSASLQFNKGGRVGKAIGGSLDLEARKKQSQADFLARQPGAQPAQPQPPAVNPQQPAVNPQPPKATSFNPFTSQQPAVNPQPPAAVPAVRNNNSEYFGGTGSYGPGGIEDSRNIALNQLAGMGIDISKYSKMTATDTSGPKFKGLSMNEIFAMDENTAKETLGFDPAVEGSNAEFEEFLRVNDPGPQKIGPGGPPGMKTEFMNQDELSQILNRGIPYYMQTARDLGENYTLEEMLAMSDDDLAMLNDRYNKKMGYGQYRPTSNINTGSTDKSQVQETMEQYKDIQNQGTGIGLGSQYATGGRVELKYGGDAYGQSTKVKSAMNVDYNDPFNKLMSNDSGRFIKSTSDLTRYAKNLNKLKNSKQSKAALRKSLLVQNEKTRKDALKRLSLLKKLYSGGKSV